MTVNTIAAGHMLIEAKRQVGHGEWSAWISANCTIAARTAQAYMKLAIEYAALPPAEAQRVADLPLRDALRAIATPAEAPERTQRTRRADMALTTSVQADVSAFMSKARGKLTALKWGDIKTKDVEAARKYLKAALEALDRLEVAGSH